MPQDIFPVYERKFIVTGNLFPVTGNIFTDTGNRVGGGGWVCQMRLRLSQPQAWDWAWAWAELGNMNNFEKNPVV